MGYVASFPNPTVCTVVSDKPLADPLQMGFPGQACHHGLFLGPTP